MSPEQWTRVKEIFAVAADAAPADRAGLLDRACGGDESLRREVEALLAADVDDGFLEPAPPLEPTERAPGTVVDGKYRIEALIGRGGMGEVYRAVQLALGRTVALKLLTLATADGERRRRFAREARLASALAHENVAHVYEFGETGGVAYIAMEYVAGPTLRARAAGAPVPPAEAVDLATQVASALAEAHARGIVHRDVKPENVIVTPAGRAKVLDFGIARLESRPAGDAADSTLETGPGVVIGTVRYMSPEQVRGLTVDARTDVWSLGVVLYELLAGRPPFDGPTPSDVVAAVLEREPAPLERDTDPSGDLWLVVERALSKRASDRFANCGEMLAELRRARTEPRARETATTLAHTREPGGRGDRTARRRLAVALVAGLALAAAGVVAWRLSSGPASPGAPALTIERLTSVGNVGLAAAAPDGRFVAYTTIDAGTQSLWLRQVRSGTDRRAVPPTDGQFTGVAFSPDGEYVYYGATSANDRTSVLYRIPVGGDAPTVVLRDVDGPVTFSPDGRRFAFVRGLGAGATALVLADREGAGEVALATRVKQDRFVTDGPAWSPDGSVIACPVFGKDADGTRFMTLVGVRPSDGGEVSLTAARWRSIGQAVWRGDGSLVVLARDGLSTSLQLVGIALPGGETREITSDATGYRCVSRANGAAVVSVQTARQAYIVVSAPGDASPPRRITRGVGAYYQVACAPDGSVLTAIEEGGNRDIWRLDPGGGAPTRLTTDPNDDQAPSASPDGRFVVFSSNRAGAYNLWRVDADGTNATRLTAGTDELGPQCTPDGWVVYTTWTKGPPTLRKVPIAGGEPVQITRVDSMYPGVSPDGRMLVCQYSPGGAGAQYRAVVLRADDGEPVWTVPGVRFAFPDAGAWQLLRWTRDGRDVTYVDVRDAGAELWAAPAAGGPPRRLTEFDADNIFYYDWSPDGSRVACLCGSIVSDVVVIKER